MPSAISLHSIPVTYRVNDYRSGLTVKIALTGSTGFIGRHVAESLVNRGHEVVEILRPGRQAAARTRNFVEFDLGTPPRDAFERLGSPEVLVHLAWGGLPNYESVHHVESELPRHVKFLSALAGQGLSQIVIAGTCFEYGLKEGQIKETDPVAPVTEYARAKVLLHEHLLRMDSVTAIVWARLFYPYGPGQSLQSLYGQFERACESGDKFFPMSPGDQLRDYLPVEDMADYLARLAGLRIESQLVVNVCSGRPISIQQLVEKWARNCSSQITLQTGVYPYPAHEPRNAWGDDEMLRSLLRNLE